MFEHDKILRKILQVGKNYEKILKVKKIWLRSKNVEKKSRKIFVF